jgi:ABC-type transport system substrate-binding protein
VDLVAAASGEPDPGERASMYAEAQRLFAEDVVTIPLWLEHPLIAYRDNVNGDDAYASPETLNIGATLLLDFRAIEMSEPGG